MTRLKCLLSVLAGICAYVILSAIYGQSGVYAYNQMQEQRRQISVHTAEIQKINDELFLEYNALFNDSEVVAAYARKMDYIAKGERLVKITGLHPVENKIYDTGTVLRHQKFVYLPESICKEAGVIVFLLIALLFILFSLVKQSSKQKQSATTNIEQTKQNETLVPIYDLPQI